MPIATSFWMDWAEFQRSKLTRRTLYLFATVSMTSSSWSKFTGRPRPRVPAQDKVHDDLLDLGVPALRLVHDLDFRERVAKADAEGILLQPGVAVHEVGRALHDRREGRDLPGDVVPDDALGQDLLPAADARHER